MSEEGINRSGDGDRNLTEFFDSAVATLSAVLGELGHPISSETVASALSQVAGCRAVIGEVLGSPVAEDFVLKKQVEPTNMRADALMRRGMDVEKERQGEKRKKMALVMDKLDGVFKAIVGDKYPVGSYESQLQDLAKRLIGLGTPSNSAFAEILRVSPFVKNTLSINPRRINSLFLSSARRDDQDGSQTAARKAVGELEEVLYGAGQMQNGFEKLRSDYYAYFTQDPKLVWQLDDVAEVNMERQANEIYQGAMEASNGEKEKFNPLLGKKFVLPEAVQNLDSEDRVYKEIFGERQLVRFKKLKPIARLRMLATIDPTTEYRFRVMQGAIVKLAVMHGLLYAHNVDFRKAEAVKDILGARLDALIESGEKYGNPVLNPPRNEEGELEDDLSGSTWHQEIDRFEMGSLKGLVSIVRKFILEEALSISKNIGEDARVVITDVIRARLFLIQADCYKYDGDQLVFDSKRFEQNVRKVLGVLCSLLGDDVAKVTCSINSGGINEYSTGKWHAIQVVLHVKHAGAHNDPCGGAMGTNIDYAELQIIAHLTPEELAEDRRYYMGNKASKTREKLGANLMFGDFILQLAEMIRRNVDFGYEQESDPKSVLGNKPFTRENHRERALFVKILTARDSDGKLINGEVLEQLLENQYSRKILLEAAKRLNKEDHEIVCIKGFAGAKAGGGEDVDDVAARKVAGTDYNLSTAACRRTMPTNAEGQYMGKAQEAKLVLTNCDFRKGRVKTELDVRLFRGNWQVQRKRYIHPVTGRLKTKVLSPWVPYDGILGRRVERCGSTDKYYVTYSQIKNKKQGLTREVERLAYEVDKSYGREKCWKYLYPGSGKGEPNRVLYWEVVSVGEGGDREEHIVMYMTKYGGGDKMDERVISGKRALKRDCTVDGQADEFIPDIMVSPSSRAKRGRRVQRIVEMVTADLVRKRESEGRKKAKRRRKGKPGRRSKK